MVQRELLLAMDANHNALGNWWRLVYGMPLWNYFFASYQKRLLNEEMQSFFANENASNDAKKLHNLYNLVLHAQHIHYITSHKPCPTYLHELGNWLEYKVSQTPSRAMDLPITSIHFANRASLYADWMHSSHGGLFARRSPATQNLDKVVKWYSTALILDELEALECLCHAINAWCIRPEGNKRLLAVSALDKFVKQRQQVYNSKHHKEPSPVRC